MPQQATVPLRARPSRRMAKWRLAAVPLISSALLVSAPTQALDLGTVAQGATGVALVGVNVVSGLIQSAAGLVQSLVAPEPGDYSAFQMTWNLISPRGADNPVNKTTDQQYAYPLVGTKAGGTSMQFNPRAYYKWQQVTLPASSGALCGDGSPYKIFVNLTPKTSNLQVNMEPGGVCFDYEQCAGTTGWNAFNPNGIADDYTSLISGPIHNLQIHQAGPLESPMYSRTSIATATHFKMQDWNNVFMPYCSGDVHMGDKTTVYTSPDGKSTRVQYYRGVKNVMAAVGWLRENLPRPAQLYLSGQSAGSAGIDGAKPIFRQLLDPYYAQYNMQDSGSLYPGDWTRTSPEVMPSAPAYKRVVSELFNYDPAKPNAKTPMLLLKQLVPSFDYRDLSTVRTGYAAKWPRDRSLYVQSLTDLDFSGFMYQYNPRMIELSNAENKGQAAAARAFLSPQGKYTTELHLRDMERMWAQINGMSPNTGYFSPSGRTLNMSHCLTAFNYENTTNPDTGNDVVAAISNLVNPANPPILRERAKDLYWGVYQPLGATSKNLLSLVMPDFFTPVSLPN